MLHALAETLTRGQGPWTTNHLRKRSIASRRNLPGLCITLGEQTGRPRHIRTVTPQLVQGLCSSEATFGLPLATLRAVGTLIVGMVLVGFEIDAQSTAR
jgi:hypothetical protein